MQPTTNKSMVLNVAVYNSTRGGGIHPPPCLIGLIVDKYNFYLFFIYINMGCFAVYSLGFSTPPHWALFQFKFTCNTFKCVIPHSIICNNTLQQSFSNNSVYNDYLLDDLYIYWLIWKEKLGWGNSLSFQLWLPIFLPTPSNVFLIDSYHPDLFIIQQNVG